MPPHGSAIAAGVQQHSPDAPTPRIHQSRGSHRGRAAALLAPTLGLAVEPRHRSCARSVRPALSDKRMSDSAVPPDRFRVLTHVRADARFATLTIARVGPPARSHFVRAIVRVVLVPVIPMATFRWFASEAAE
jgi:hypothetical protein